MIFDVPRINTTVRNSLVATNSTVIYNTDNNQYEYYNGTSWKPFGEGGVISFNTRTGNVVLLDSDIAGLGDFTVSGTLTINNDIVLGSEALKIMTSSVDPNISGVVANTGSIILKNDGTLWQKLDTGDVDWSTLNHSNFTNEPTGFPVGANGQIDHSSSSISFNDGNYTFSISPTSGSYIVLIKGRQYRKTTTESVAINSAVEGLHYFYFNSSGVLETSTSLTASTFLNNALVASVYWDTTNNKSLLFGNERHGCTMDSHTQVRLHFERGAVYVSGMALNDFTVNGDGTSEAHLTFTANSGELRDEDILHSLSTRARNASIPIFYREGTVWRSSTPSINGGYYARALGSSGTPEQIAYNQLSGGVWSRVNVSNTRFCCYHVIGTNDVNHPFVIVMGTAEYQTKPEAQSGAINEISSLFGLPFIEMVFIGTVLFECKTSTTNSLKASTVSVDGANYVDWRFRTTLNPSTANVSNHNNLGGINGLSPYYHSNQPISTTDDVTFKSLTATSGVNATGTIKFNNITYPSSDGSNGQVLSTNGSGTLSFTSITQNHNSLTGIQGGGSGNYYHSNQPINTTDSVQFSGLTVLGDLTVSGTTTTVNSTILQIQDKNIELGKVTSPSDIFADGGGITLLGDSNKTLTWIDSTDSWTSSEHLDLVSGKVYKINGSTVLSATQVLGKNVPSGDIVGTSDTQSLSNKTLDGFTLNGDINSTLYAADFDLLDNITSALSFDATGKNGILEIDTVNGSEKVKMSGGLDVTGSTILKNLTASGTLILNGITFPTSDGSPNQVLKTDGSGNLSFGTITQDHNLLTNIQGGGGGNYYHSNQPINTTDAVTFNNLTVVSGVAATGTIKFNNITYPTSDGTPNQVLKTDGTGNLSFGTITQDHNLLTNIQGGGGGNYYHSNQPINSTDNVTFNNLTIVSGVAATGTIRFNNITYPGADGVSGQVMVTDGAGNISFSTVNSAGTILDTYINSKTAVINNNSSSNIQTIFSQAISGIYTFWISSDPRIKGTFYFNENDSSNSVLESISSLVSSKQDNAGTLNVYISGINVIIQNKLGSNITLCIRRETTPLINPEPGNVSISNHNNLYGLQGGLTNTYYHSNQPINTTDTVLFNELNVTNNITATGTISTANTVTFGAVNVPIITDNSTGLINDVTTLNIGGYRYTSASTLSISGFANGSNGKLLYLHNSSSVNIILKNGWTNSNASNRIITGTGTDLIIKPDKSITLQYDSFSSRWRVIGGAGGNPSENPETLNLGNSPATIDFSQYATTSFRIKNPDQITLSNGTNGVWYTLAIVSDGAYSFTSETRFPLNNAQPVPSSGTVDLYTFHCIDTVSGTRYLATFAYDYSGVTLP